MLKTCPIELVGSRRIVPHLVKETTDYDYMAEDTLAVRTWLTTNGWFTNTKSILQKYYDVATTAIYFDRYGNQCTLKNKTYYPAVKVFWKFMDKNPSIFIQKYWKSSPNNESSADVISVRINEFLINTTATNRNILTRTYSFIKKLIKW